MSCLSLSYVSHFCLLAFKFLCTVVLGDVPFSFCTLTHPSHLRQRLMTIAPLRDWV